MSNVVKLPSAVTSYVTVTKRRQFWDVVLVTPSPVKGMKAMRTCLCSFSDRADAYRVGGDTAVKMQRPFKAKGVAA